MDIEKILECFDDKEISCRFDSSEIQKNKVAAVLPYFIPILFFLPVVSDKNSLFCKFHANQQATWLIITAILHIIGKIISVIPVVGWIANIGISIIELAVSIALMYGASKGKALRLPFIGEMINLF